MKKILVLFLSLVLLIPSVSIANTEDELIGCWIGLREDYPGDVTYFLVDLYEDHSALYESNTFTKYDDEGFQIIRTGNWELKEDGVHVYYKSYGNNKETVDFHLELTDQHYLAYKLAVSYILFTKMPGCVRIKNTTIVNSWD